MHPSELLGAKRERTSPSHRLAFPWALRIATTLLIVLLAVPACAQSEPPPPLATDGDPVQEQAAAKGDVTASPTLPKDGERKLVRDAELALEVDSYENTRATIERALSESHGFIADAKVEHRDGRVSSAVLTLRVPAQRLDALLASCAALGTVLHESLSTRDITEEYYDARARLANARKLEERILQLLQRDHNGIKELLEVERELGRVREQIETIQGKLQRFESQVALSKFVVTITTRERFSAGRPKTLAEELGQTLTGSWEALVGAGRWLLLVVAAFLPWLIPLGLVAYAVYRFSSWLGRRSAARREQLRQHYALEMGYYSRPEHARGRAGGSGAPSGQEMGWVAHGGEEARDPEAQQQVQPSSATDQTEDGEPDGTP